MNSSEKSTYTLFSSLFKKSLFMEVFLLAGGVSAFPGELLKYFSKVSLIS
jgi:hypothetical protein